MNQTVVNCPSNEPSDGVTYASVIFSFATVCVQLCFTLVFFLLKRTRLLELMHLKKKAPKPVEREVRDMQITLQTAAERTDEIRRVLAELSSSLSNRTVSSSSAPPSPLRDEDPALGHNYF